MKLYIDDIRPTPEGWGCGYIGRRRRLHCSNRAASRTSASITIWTTTRGARVTGYDVEKWIEEAVLTRGFVPSRIVIRSSNPVGRERMHRGIEAIERAGKAQSKT